MGQVLWEEHTFHGLVVEPEERFRGTIDTLAVLRAASTWGEVRAATLAPWAARYLMEVQDDAWEPIGDEAPWDYREAVESLIEIVPLSYDARNTASWVGQELLDEHAVVSGASPGGNSDSYRVRDRDGFMLALMAAGHVPVHQPGFLDELMNAF